MDGDIKKMVQVTPQDILQEFNKTLGINWTAPEQYILELKSILNKDLIFHIDSPTKIKNSLIEMINHKLLLNKQVSKSIIDTAASFGIIFNFHEKDRLMKSLDVNDKKAFQAIIRGKTEDLSLIEKLMSLFLPCSENETLNKLNEELETDARREEILQSLFSGYVFHYFSLEQIHKHFSNSPENEVYYNNFYDYLKTHHPSFFERSCSIIYLEIDQETFNQSSSIDIFRNRLFKVIQDSFKRLNNHCYLGVVIKPIFHNNKNIQWDLYSDTVLYAEKFLEVELKKGYFKPEKISKTTSEYISELNLDKANFHISNEGFAYKDCFILSNKELYGENYSMLLLFEKNERDETVVPCPACRSYNIQGNSYPIINVRSWECNNTFCPDKSKYNRGKRYSLASLLKQEAIEKDENLIPVESLRKWKHDITAIESETEVLSMLLRHYSLFNDNVLIISNLSLGNKLLGRNLSYENFPQESQVDNLVGAFYNSAFFQRFRLEKETIQTTKFENLSSTERVKVFNGNSFDVLGTLEGNSIDGAVTSPPYYNAREYAQWPNIYCYLYDMFNIAKEVYRVLKPGSPFVFNIFDYFDNENNLVFSLMGKKRMILGAYIIHLFKHIGFSIQDNIIWTKGEIEGKRNFNQGNLSPYYQAPFNSWEHIFVFSKGETANFNKEYPKILNLRPVIKMVKGKNVLGHTAPYPKEIPNLLFSMLPEKGTILDPFSGSMTTGRAAFECGYSSINIDYLEEYCKLGLELLDEEQGQITLNL
ncbi:DNA modification methylase [Paenibacillus intestini]|nr:DNA modification methylase [Paenibacillus intestini]